MGKYEIDRKRKRELRVRGEMKGWTDTKRRREKWDRENIYHYCWSV